MKIFQMVRIGAVGPCRTKIFQENSCQLLDHVKLKLGVASRFLFGILSFRLVGECVVFASSQELIPDKVMFSFPQHYWILKSDWSDGGVDDELSRNSSSTGTCITDATYIVI